MADAADLHRALVDGLVARGFAEEDVREGALGLVCMRERIALVGGTLGIESTPASGTALVAHVPLTATPRP